jgi:hypothetical protein
VDPNPVPAEELYNRLAAEFDGVTTLDLDGLTCPRLPVCDAVVDGLVVRRDHNHVTASYLEAHVDQFADAFGELDVLE